MITWSMLSEPNRANRLKNWTVSSLELVIKLSDQRTGKTRAKISQIEWFSGLNPHYADLVSFFLKKK